MMVPVVPPGRIYLEILKATGYYPMQTSQNMFLRRLTPAHGARPSLLQACKTRCAAAVVTKLA